MTVDTLAERFHRAGLPIHEVVVQFQRDLAGHVFYTHPREKPYRWGIQSPVPDNFRHEPYEDECVALTDALPASYVIRADGRIEVNGQVHAQNAHILVEGQALQFEWDVDIKPHHTTYFLRLPVRPRNDMGFWQALVDAAEQTGLTRVNAASDDHQHWWIRPSTRLQVEPFYGARRFSDDVPVSWGSLCSTAVEEVGVFYQLLASGMRWPPLEWQQLTQECRPADFYCGVTP
ncbi:hypothetical protein [Deinococcus sp. QL22]|uniref:hypothetical protein n=1 Tax=Deinococcus sp. QL22 TaxID=2939437 RepID=UPI00201701C6|nr:hypothetical protein [Deinococcus sp. QL22]UQN08451.1 hypothetical protein M1R55_17175 [Deinococcus sp. QL22]